jgi:hypothetical protein
MGSVLTELEKKMNQEQKQKVIAHLEPFWQLKVEERIAEVYKDYQDLSSVYIGYYSVEEFNHFSKKMISQLGQIIGTSLSNILPFQYQFQNDFGSGNLETDLANLNQFITNKDFPTAVTYLYRLVYYQVQNGFWDKDSWKDDKGRSERLNALQHKLGLVTEQITQSVTTSGKLIEQLNVERENIQQLVNTKNKELEQIAALVPTARTNGEEITKLLNTSTATNESINSLVSQQRTNLDETTKKIEELRIVKEQFDKEVSAGEKKNASFEKMLASVKEKSGTFDDRIAVLNELIGKEGAVKLFSTFNDRKNELATPVRNWAIASIVTGMVSLAVIIGIFTNFFGWLADPPKAGEIGWEFLIINSLKSIPIMVVLFFTIRQYARERNFQEEYAFRSAIALTVQAYADISGTKKEELIFKAVSNIYQTPSTMKEKQGFSLFRNRVLTDTLKDLSEALKNFKG